jgi:hypothetical protein
MPLQATSGAASYDAFGGGVPVVPNYIEDVFSTYLYTGNGSTQTITNNIDLSTKGGMVWIKNRGAVANNAIQNTVNGVNSILYSNLTNAAGSPTAAITAFNTTGFSLGSAALQNTSANTYASWTFREQAKFFDVVTYVGNGTAGRTVSHNLGSTPGCIIIKSSSRVSDWTVYHTSVGTTKTLILNSTVASADYGNNISSVTSTSFNVTSGSDTNASSEEYVAYLFAHNAGGFGLTGTDNVISCGSYTGNGSSTGPTITLGYEPQWLMVKASSTTADWFIVDNMRGFSETTNRELFPNLSNAEDTAYFVAPTATGFQPKATSVLVNQNAQTYIYIAIRRGPMKVPTDATKVYYGATRSGTGATATVTGVPFPPDLLITGVRTPGASYDQCVNDRLRGVRPFLYTDGTAAEITSFPQLSSYNMNGVTLTNDPGGYGTNQSGSTLVNWFFGRAPSFFDEVCYTGTGSARTVSHNLGVAPEMMIFKRRDTTANWRVYNSSQPASDLGTLNSTIYFQTDSDVLNSTAPTSSVFTVGTNAQTNASGGTYVAYLFATTVGVSKVGSYTGTGTTLQVNCGFTGGSRFVLIKRVDDTGGWYVWDSARGIVAGNDPYLLLNSTAAEVTSTDYVDTYSAGFEISSTAPAAINASGGSFIFFAVS